MSLHEPRRSTYFPNPCIPVGLWHVRGQLTYEDHDHDFFEIAVIASGKGRHGFSGMVLPVEAGDVFVVKPGEIHSWKETQELDLLNIMISDLEAIPELLQLRAHPAFDAIFFHEPKLRNQQKGRGRLHLNLAGLNEVLNLERRLEHALHRQEQPFPLIARLVFLNLVSLLCESYMAAPQEEQRTALRIAEAVRHLEVHFADPPSHEELAAITHSSVPNFYRLFRAATGTTPSSYVNQLRLREAGRLLRQSSQAITEIAYSVGFADSNYFSKIFHKYQGMSPSQFRCQSGLSSGTCRRGHPSPRPAKGFLLPDSGIS